MFNFLVALLLWLRCLVGDGPLIVPGEQLGFGVLSFLSANGRVFIFLHVAKADLYQWAFGRCCSGFRLRLSSFILLWIDLVFLICFLDLLSADADLLFSGKGLVRRQHRDFFRSLFRLGLLLLNQAVIFVNDRAFWRLSASYSLLERLVYLFAIAFLCECLSFGERLLQLVGTPLLNYGR